MSDAWSQLGSTVALGQPGALVTLVEGPAFCISSRTGDVVPGGAQGLFFREARLLSRLEVRLNNAVPEALATQTLDPFSATFVGRMPPRPGRIDSSLLLLRRRYVGRGMREDIVIRNSGPEPAFCSLEVRIAADFADIGDVKEGHPFTADGEQGCEVSERGVEFRVRRGSHKRGVKITSSEPPHGTEEVLTWELIVPARGEWSTCLQVTPSIDGEDIEPRFRCGVPVERTTPGERLAKWRREAPGIDVDDAGLRRVLATSVEDLGALRIFDPDYPERAVVAAGAPWSMTVFGRDSLITAWMALPVDPDLALGVLHTLARFQGRDVDPRREEEPGRILHEMRPGEGASLSLASGRLDYGSADATPLFVMLLGELRRWGLAREAVDQLLPHADRALEWVEHFGDRDGDGYVEYQRATDRGSLHQGWKDSPEAVRFADGSPARTPIALAEVQGYVYAAYVARMHFAREAGDAETAEHYRKRADALKDAFNRDFWVEERGWYAMALDGDKRPVDALASNVGHCLWTGIVDEERAAVVAARMLSPELFSGWGVRTLASDMAGFNPVSYHLGSVWPHDNAIAAAGLMRYGFVDEAQRVIRAQLDAALALGGRLPELFTGLDRREFPTIVGYPTSCSPQAWASASPLLHLRTLLRLDPWVPQGKVFCAPVLLEGMERLAIDRIPLAGARVRVECDGDDVRVEGLPAGIELVTAPRSPLIGS